MLAAAGVVISILIFGLGVGLIVWFILTVRSAVILVPEDRRKFSLWLLWLLLIPVVNYFVAWFLIPFAIPKTLEAGNGSSRSKKVTKHLFQLGLAVQILPIIHFLAAWSQLGELILSAVSVVLIVIYWIIVYKYKQRFLAFVA